MKILDAMSSDSAMYSCVAENEDGFDVRHYNLTVYGKLKLFARISFLTMYQCVFIHGYINIFLKIQFKPFLFIIKFECKQYLFEKSEPFKLNNLSDFVFFKICKAL